MDQDKNNPSNNSLEPKKDSKGRFAKGNSYGKGRPLGSRNRVYQLIDKFGEEIVPRVIENLKIAIEQGDVKSSQYLFDKIYMPHKDRTSIINNVPKIDNIEDLGKAYKAIFQHVINGEISIDDGTKLYGLLRENLQFIQATDHEVRIRELEANEEKRTIMQIPD